MADEAKANIGLGSTEQLFYAAPTDYLSDLGAPLALCVRAKTRTLFYTNLFRTSGGYVLGANDCKTNSYYLFTAADFESAISDKLIAEDVPAMAELTLMQRLRGHWGLGALAFGLVYGLGRRVWPLRPAQGRISLTATEVYSRKALAILTSAAHAAHALDENGIARIDAELSDLPVDDRPSNIWKAVEKIDPAITTREMEELAHGIDQTDRKSLFKSALNVSAMNHRFSEPAEDFLSNLAQAFALTIDDVDAVFADFLHQPKAA